MKTAHCFLVATLCGVLVACSNPPTQPYTLSSGRTIRVLSVVQLQFTQASPALMLRYETDMAIDDQALQAEVEEIWKDFRKDADNAKVTSAIVSANEKPTGIVIKSSQAKNFVFERRPDGTWVRMGGGGTAPAG